MGQISNLELLQAALDRTGDREGYARTLLSALVETNDALVDMRHLFPDALPEPPAPLKFVPASEPRGEAKFQGLLCEALQMVDDPESDAKTLLLSLIDHRPALHILRHFVSDDVPPARRPRRGKRMVELNEPA